jgi:hypothetical protein
LHMVSIPLACTAPSSVPMTSKFGHLMVSQMSCIFHLFLFIFEKSLSECSNESTLSSSSVILFSV